MACTTTRLRVSIPVLSSEFLTYLCAGVYGCGRMLNGGVLAWLCGAALQQRRLLPHPAVCAHPRANADEDELNYNPRGKRGKMIIAAARKLVSDNNGSGAAGRAVHGVGLWGMVGVERRTAEAAGCPRANDELKNRFPAP